MDHFSVALADVDVDEKQYENFRKDLDELIRLINDYMGLYREGERLRNE